MASSLDRLTEKSPAAKYSPASALRCRRKFLSKFPGGFRDDLYLAWERDYKALAHARWEETLAQSAFRSLLHKGEFIEAAARAVRVESRTNLLFSFEKMALRDAVKTAEGARLFSTGLYDFLYRPGTIENKFARWCDAVAAMPRRQTRAFTWPVITVFPFIADPKAHIFLKPTVTRIAAQKYGFDFTYESRPSWNTYASLLQFAATIRRDLRDLHLRDMIDLQSFIWVQGSDEYA